MNMSGETYLSNDSLQVGWASTLVVFLVPLALIYEMLVDLVVGQHRRLRLNNLHGGEVA